MAEQQPEKKQIKTVGLIINSYKEQIVQIGRQVIDLLEHQHVTVLAMGEEAEALQVPSVGVDQFCSEAQVVLVMGIIK